jgi:hypothetical protein
MSPIAGTVRRPGTPGQVPAVSVLEDLGLRERIAADQGKDPIEITGSVEGTDLLRAPPAPEASDSLEPARCQRRHPPGLTRAPIPHRGSARRLIGRLPRQAPGGTSRGRSPGRRRSPRRRPGCGTAETVRACDVAGMVRASAGPQSWSAWIVAAAPAECSDAVAFQVVTRRPPSGEGQEQGRCRAANQVAGADPRDARMGTDEKFRRGHQGPDRLVPARRTRGRRRRPPPRSNRGCPRRFDVAAIDRGALGEVVGSTGSMRDPGDPL